MSPTLILLTALAFGLGLGLSMWQTRRRLRARLADRLAAEAEERIRQELLARLERRARSGETVERRPAEPR